MPKKTLKKTLSLEAQAAEAAQADANQADLLLI
jgi:hypothetical protein